MVMRLAWWGVWSALALSSAGSVGWIPRLVLGFAAFLMLLLSPHGSFDALSQPIFGLLPMGFEQMFKEQLVRTFLWACLPFLAVESLRNEVESVRSTASQHYYRAEVFAALFGLTLALSTVSVQWRDPLRILGFLFLIGTLLCAYAGGRLLLLQVWEGRFVGPPPVTHKPR